MVWVVIPIVRFLSLLMTIVPMASAIAQSGPQPPCGGTTLPSYPGPNQPPSVGNWRNSDLRQQGWSPAPCLSWNGKTRLVAALAGTFIFNDGIDQLLDRIGAFSRYSTIHYWSTSRQSWKPLMLEAGLLTNSPRPTDSDLKAADFVGGHSFDYFVLGDAGRTIYRLIVRERTAKRVVLAIENISPIRLAFVTLFDVGALQSVIFLEGNRANEWHYFQLMRATDGASTLAVRSTGSFSNRLTAFYGYVATPLPSEPKQQ
ncbi:MAG: hypothetical protein JSR91_00845 [Proteobacteria bacterium]|nr:hypothetical protein [Pseudomonadota bacterium]